MEKNNTPQFIRLYKNVLPPHLCFNIIHTYEKLWREQEEDIKKMSLCYNESGVKTCGACDCQRLDIMQHEEFKPYVNEAVKYLQATIEQYKQDTNLHKTQWPKKYGYE